MPRTSGRSWTSRVLALLIGLGALAAGVSVLFTVVTRGRELGWLMSVPFVLVGLPATVFGIVALIRAATGKLPTWVDRPASSASSNVPSDEDRS